MRRHKAGASLNLEAVRKLKDGVQSEDLTRLKNEILPYLRSLSGPGFLVRPCQESADAIETAVKLADLIERGDVKSGSEIQHSGNRRPPNSPATAAGRPEDE